MGSPERLASVSLALDWPRWEHYTREISFPCLPVNFSVPVNHQLPHTYQSASWCPPRPAPEERVSHIYQDRTL